MTAMSDLDVNLGFIFAPDNRLFTTVDMAWKGEALPLALSALLHYVFQHDADLPEAVSDFCLAMAKSVKKVRFGDDIRFAIPNDHDVAYCFKKATELGIDLHWTYNGVKQALRFDGPLPLTVKVKQRGDRLLLSLENRDSWRNDPMGWQRFEFESVRYIFSSGVVAQNLPTVLEDLILAFLDHEQLFYQGEKARQFVAHIYEPHKGLIGWQVQADFASLLPQDVAPQAKLALGYADGILSMQLSYLYNGVEVRPETGAMTLKDRETGQTYQRSKDMEGIYQDDLMTLVQEHGLPFMLQSPGDIARFLHKVVPELKRRHWAIYSEVPDFHVIEDPVDLSYTIHNEEDRDWFSFHPVVR